MKADGTRPGLGTFATFKEAQEELETARAMLGRATAEALTFAKFARSVLDLREADGLRSVEQERDRFRLHLETSALGGMPLASVTSRDVAELVRVLSRKRAADKRQERKLSRKTVARCLAIVSAVFSEGLQRGLVDRNPCTGIRIKKDAKAPTVETWAYLNPEEQHALTTCEAIPEADRLLMRFAIGTGLRQGEQWNLELRDIHVGDEDPHVFVRFGSKGKAPKSGKTRRVPLFGDGLAAAREWLALLPSWCPPAVNAFGLVFPTRSGCRRQPAKPFGKWDVFRGYLAKAGVTKALRWHDLRHTCASSLVAGWWGRTWAIEEIKELLGHSSIMVTQIYAHLGETSLKAAARGTGYALVTPPDSTAAVLANSAMISSSGPAGTRTQDLRIKSAGGSPNGSTTSGGLSAESGASATSLADALVALAREGKLEEMLAVAAELARASEAARVESIAAVDRTAR
jgi:integrase